MVFIRFSLLRDPGLSHIGRIGSRSAIATRSAARRRAQRGKPSRKKDKCVRNITNLQSNSTAQKEIEQIEGIFPIRTIQSYRTENEPFHFIAVMVTLGHYSSGPNSKILIPRGQIDRAWCIDDGYRPFIATVILWAAV